MARELEVSSAKAAGVGKWAPLALAISFVPLLAIGPLYFPDSPTYVEGYAHRSPLYPLLIWALRGIFGAWHVEALVAVQLLLGLVAVVSTGNWFRRRLNLGPAEFILTLLILASPYFIPKYHIGNAVLSEAFAYPAFLLTSRWLMEGLLARRSREIFLALAGTLLLVLARKQFLFVWPAIALVIAGIHLHNRHWRQTLILLVALAGAVVGASVAERTWNLVRYGHFSPIPFTGMQLIVAPLIVSASGDVVAMPSSRHDAYFRAVESEAERRQLTLRANADYASFHGKMETFRINYNPLVEIAKTKAADVFGEDSEDSFARQLAADRGMTETAWPLIRANAGEYFRLYALNAMNGLGGDFRLGFSFVVIQVVAGFLALLQFSIRPTPLATTLLVMLVLHVGNALAVAVVEPTLVRYTFYTASLVTWLLLVALGRGMALER